MISRGMLLDLKGDWDGGYLCVCVCCKMDDHEDAMLCHGKGMILHTGKIDEVSVYCIYRVVDKQCCLALRDIDRIVSYRNVPSCSKLPHRAHLLPQKRRTHKPLKFKKCHTFCFVLPTHFF